MSSSGQEVESNSIDAEPEDRESLAESDKDNENDGTPEPSEHVKLEDVYNPHNFTWEELELFLYEWDWDIADYVAEYHDWKIFDTVRKKINDVKEGKVGIKDKIEHKDNGSKTKVNFGKGGKNVFLNLTDEAAQVVEFYVPWCPHCQNYKYEYATIAAEVKRRSTFTPILFHALSCDTYHQICKTYNITGFPTILGWKQGENITTRGKELNPEDGPDLTADMLGDMLGLDLANEELQFKEKQFENSVDRRIHEIEMAKLAFKAAATKASWHEHHPNTHNDRYHNAALSLAFAIKSQLFQTMTNDGKIDDKRRRALVDFLNLLDWASPQSWGLRAGFVDQLQLKIEAEEIQDREDVEDLIQLDIEHHRSSKGTSAWGFVNLDIPSSNNDELGHKKKQDLIVRDEKWTKSCTHSQPGKGFTCGLWNLFHILTIGSSKPEHKLYGFQRGYVVSPHHVAQTIRYFIAYFFSCDVCRTNFLNMYDSCGHNHCNRLKSEIEIGQKNRTNPSEKELVLWLWEVHNSVNTRLMREAASRQNRLITQNETLAALFPTRKMCPGCWLNRNMTKWDEEKVFIFLDRWFWPEKEAADNNFRSIIRGATKSTNAGNHIVYTSTSSRRYYSTEITQNKFPSTLSFFFTNALGDTDIIMIILVICFLLTVIFTMLKHGERRKKFVDSRFVKKKRSFC